MSVSRLVGDLTETCWLPWVNIESSLGCDEWFSRMFLLCIDMMLMMSDENGLVCPRTRGMSAASSTLGFYPLCVLPTHSTLLPLLYPMIKDNSRSMFPSKGLLAT